MGTRSITTTKEMESSQKEESLCLAGFLALFLAFRKRHENVSIISIDLSFFNHCVREKISFRTIYKNIFDL
jgi:hypothetical protein